MRVSERVKKARSEVSGRKESVGRVPPGKARPGQVNAVFEAAGQTGKEGRRTDRQAGGQAKDMIRDAPPCSTRLIWYDGTLLSQQK